MIRPALREIKFVMIPHSGMFAPLCRRRHAVRGSIPSWSTFLASCQTTFFCLSFFCLGFCSSQLNIVEVALKENFK